MGMSHRVVSKVNKGQHILACFTALKNIYLLGNSTTVDYNLYSYNLQKLQNFTTARVLAHSLSDYFLSALACLSNTASSPDSTSDASPGVPVANPPMLFPPMKTCGKEDCKGVMI